jgi:hypothetical protein
MTKRSTAHYFLEGLTDIGVDYISANLGTDHVSLIEELARWDDEGRRHPQVILCRHEVVAVHMAAGYALATGLGQAVFVHVDAGTANACMAIQNVFRYRLPVMLFAGRAPFTLHGELLGSRETYVHFVQDSFDPASIVRPYVKWDYSLPSGVVVKEALARAAAFMQSDPPGPVYMLLPRETLAETWDDSAMPAYPPTRYGSVRAGGIEPARAATIAEALMSAENPIAVTAYLGRKPQAVAVLDRLARTCGIRVVEFNSIDLNISQESPCFAGFDPAIVSQADLGHCSRSLRQAGKVSAGALPTLHPPSAATARTSLIRSSLMRRSTVASPLSMTGAPPFCTRASRCFNCQVSCHQGRSDRRGRDYETMTVPLAPAVGQVISDLILDGIAPLDLDAFRLSRFSEGRLDRQSGAM